MLGTRILRPIGEMGNGETTPPIQTTPTPTSSLGIAHGRGDFFGDDHTCAILDNGSVSCWGRMCNGQLGNGGNSNKNTPTLTSSLGANRTAVALSSGQYHTCAILDNGSVSCGDRDSSANWVMEEQLNKNTPTLTSSLGTGRTAVAISSEVTVPYLRHP